MGRLGTRIAVVPASDPLRSVPRDSGCEASPSCLSCPLVRCKHDEPVSPRAREQAAVTRARHEAIRQLRAAGHSTPAIASALGVSRRTVFRALEGWAA